MPLKAFRWPCLSPPQSPVPGLSDNKLALSGLSSHSFASGGGSRFTVMFGQTRAYSALMPSHFSSPASVPGLIASTGHSGSQTPQSMHSSGDDEHVLALVEAVDGTYLHAVHVFTFDAAFIDDVGHYLLRVVATPQTDRWRCPCLKSIVCSKAA